MTEIQVFKHEQFGQVRALEYEGEPWFVGKDVAERLGYRNASKALADHVDSDDKLNNESLLSLGQRGGWIINESGLYSLVMASKMPSAKQFKRWVTSEVLPTIRKTGGAYMTAEMADKIIGDPDTIIRLATQIKELREKEKINAPKVLLAESIEASNDCILIRDMAKILNQSGYKTGEKRFFKQLRADGFLCVDNTPTQKSMDLGLFRVTERTVDHTEGPQIIKTTKVTGKGQSYFANYYLGRSIAH